MGDIIFTLRFQRLRVSETDESKKLSLPTPFVRPRAVVRCVKLNE